MIDMVLIVNGTNQGAAVGVEFRQQTLYSNKSSALTLWPLTRAHH